MRKVYEFTRECPRESSKVCGNLEGVSDGSSSSRVPTFPLAHCCQWPVVSIPDDPYREVSGPGLRAHESTSPRGRGNYQERTFGVAGSASIQSSRKLPASVDADCGVLMRLHLRLSKLIAAKPTATINLVAWAPWPRRREKSNPWE